ncbi:ABC-2 type transporter [Methyloglobulus morosus KoM1]|uniref:Transport permease protein n=1 Tax=Methyloglobulus morosus KoM1 TaxID=1116472 RepID=V5C1X8_9GAMM|nr:ABC transporter permease [Methyloglobulus morosus]ESS74079.1 ABC-2 type transporter [Methyloglobulus morosus KoM1]
MNDQKETIITPNKTLGGAGREFWEYKDLLYFLAWRDFKVRYKQTVIGVAWAVIKPLLTMVVFTIVFGRLAKLPVEGQSAYPVMVFAAMLPWYFFSSSLQESSLSIVNNAQMISKIYFPRIIIPIAPFFVNLIDFAISFVILLALMACYQTPLTLKIVYLPLFLILSVVTALGVSLWIAALNAQYRDFRYIVPFIIQIGLYVSPIGFSSTIIPEQWRLLYNLNPMVGVIDGFRWCLLGEGINLYMPGLIVSITLSILLLISGIAFFNQRERKFADVL